MKAQQLVEEVWSKPDARAGSRVLGRALARLALRNHHAELRELVAAVNARPHDDEWIDGFVVALTEVGEAFDRALREQAADAELAALATESDWQRLMPLLGSWTSPSELVAGASMAKAQVSRALRSMAANEVVECCQGEADKRRRLYRLTLLGWRIADKAGVAVEEDPREVIQRAAAGQYLEREAVGQYARESGAVGKLGAAPSSSKAVQSGKSKLKIARRGRAKPKAKDEGHRTRHRSTLATAGS